MCRVLFLHFHVQVLFLAILKMVHIASAVLVFVGTLAMFLALWSWPAIWAPNSPTTRPVYSHGHIPSGVFFLLDRRHIDMARLMTCHLVLW